MKKLIPAILAFVMCMSLCACSSESSAPEASAPVAEPIATDTVLDEVETIPLPEASPPLFYDTSNMSQEELDKMVVEQGNRHGMNLFCFDNSWIYGVWAGANYTGEVVKVRYDNSDWTVIDPDTNGLLASCQAVKDGYIYYSRSNSEVTELVKVRSSGEDAKVIIPSHNGSVQIVDNHIYYTTPETWNEDFTGVTDDSSHLYRCDLNGNNVEAILEKPVYYFTVLGDHILYQDDHDNVTLHIYDMSTNEDIRINEHRSYMPIYDGSFVYYQCETVTPVGVRYTLWRTTPDGSTNEKIDLGCSIGGYLLRGNYIYYINSDDSWRIYRCLTDGSEIELVSQDSNVSTFQWVNGCLAYTTVTDEGYIDKFYICDADGSDKVEFCESDDSWSLGYTLI